MLFRSSPKAGLITALVIALHEIPQEVGDFSLLISKGFSRAKAIWANLFSSLSTVIGAFLVYKFSENLVPLPVLLAMTAGFLLYIALSDIVPEIHETTKNKSRHIKSVLLVLGVVVVLVSVRLAEGF